MKMKIKKLEENYKPCKFGKSQRQRRKHNNTRLNDIIGNKSGEKRKVTKSN